MISLSINFFITREHSIAVDVYVCSFRAAIACGFPYSLPTSRKLSLFLFAKVLNGKEYVLGRENTSNLRFLFVWTCLPICSPIILFIPSFLFPYFFPFSITSHPHLYINAQMYITGAVEILLNYISPSIALFGDFEADKDILYHNIRVYGTIFLIIIGILVFIGVKFVSKFAPIALICVLISIFSIYLGIFINYNGKNLTNLVENFI